MFFLAEMCFQTPNGSISDFAQKLKKKKKKKQSNINKQSEIHSFTFTSDDLINEQNAVCLFVGERKQRRVNLCCVQVARIYQVLYLQVFYLCCNTLCVAVVNGAGPEEKV